MSVNGDGASIVNTFDDWDAYGTLRAITTIRDGVTQVEYSHTTNDRGWVEETVTIIEGAELLTDTRSYYVNGALSTIDLVWPAPISHASHIDYVRNTTDFSLDTVEDGAGTAYATFLNRDSLGRPTDIERADLSTVTFDYDLHGRVDFQSVVRGASGEVMLRDYVYDKRGGISANTVTRIPSLGEIELRTDSYDYTEPGWLTRETRHGGDSDEEVWTYAYDGAGNRIEKLLDGSVGSSTLTEYEYTTGNRLDKVDGIEVTWDDCPNISRG